MPWPGLGLSWTERFGAPEVSLRVWPTSGTWPLTVWSALMGRGLSRLLPAALVTWAGTRLPLLPRLALVRVALATVWCVRHVLISVGPSALSWR